ncbi:MAG: hypothetical protein QOE77_3640 [Blastocatellia bacterium]|jgi:hypothetical protein|nr:hypothetical protein [Blastocatellia bacterium]
MNDFESPLLIKHRTEFTAIKFGSVTMPPEVRRLQESLNDSLIALVSELPTPLVAEARATLKAYSGGDQNFYSLFYVPVWSFLHLATTDVAASVEILATATTSHAMSLFLHLWDDHLSDGQLSVDLLRLQLRTIAWQRFQSASIALCQLMGIPHDLVAEHFRRYLTSHENAQRSANLDEYCGRFSEQFAICTLVPRLLGQGLCGVDAGEDLYRIINNFAVSWRVLDDIQDAHLDVLTENQTAVEIELDGVGREKWERCRALSQVEGRLDTDSWKELAGAIHESGCLKRLLARIDENLSTAATIARMHGWKGLAQELEESRIVL